MQAVSQLLSLPGASAAKGTKSAQPELSGKGAGEALAVSRKQPQGGASPGGMAAAEHFAALLRQSLHPAEEAQAPAAKAGSESKAPLPENAQGHWARLRMKQPGAGFRLPAGEEGLPPIQLPQRKGRLLFRLEQQQLLGEEDTPARGVEAPRTRRALPGRASAETVTQAPLPAAAAGGSVAASRETALAGARTAVLPVEWGQRVDPRATQRRDERPRGEQGPGDSRTEGGYRGVGHPALGRKAESSAGAVHKGRELGDSALARWQQAAPVVLAEAADTGVRGDSEWRQAVRESAGERRRVADMRGLLRELQGKIRFLVSQNGRAGEATLKLKPPELGELRIQLRQQEGRVVVRVLAPSEAVAAQLQEAQPELREQLAASGLRLDRLEVEHNDPAEDSEREEGDGGEQSPSGNGNPRDEGQESEEQGEEQ